MTKTTGMRASMRRSCVKTSRPDFGKSPVKENDVRASGGDPFQARCPGMSDLDSVFGGGEHVGHLLGEQVRVVVD